MTACTNVQRLFKYSTEIQTESHPLVVHSCHRHHFVKPGRPNLLRISSNKLHSNIFLLGSSTALWKLCLRGWQRTLLPLTYYHLSDVLQEIWFDFLEQNLALGCRRPSLVWRNVECLLRSQCDVVRSWTFPILHTFENKDHFLFFCHRKLKFLHHYVFVLLSPWMHVCHLPFQSDK